MVTERRHGRAAVVLATLAALALVVTVATVGTAEAATTDANTASTYFDQPAVVVELGTDGSATVTTVYTYDLTTDDEREAFRGLEGDDRAIANVTARYRDRLSRVADTAADETGREMAVTDATAELRTIDDGDTGVVALSVTWEGLAAVDGDRLTVTEPFASGFEADRRLLLVAPDGYRLAAMSPSPDAVTDGRAEWATGSDLSGFSVTVEPDPTATTASGDGAGTTATNDGTTAGNGGTTAADGTTGGTDSIDATAGDTDADGGSGSPGPGAVGAALATLCCLLLLRRRR